MEANDCRRRVKSDFVAISGESNALLAQRPSAEAAAALATSRQSEIGETEPDPLDARSLRSGSLSPSVDVLAA